MWNAEAFEVSTALATVFRWTIASKVWEMCDGPPKTQANWRAMATAAAARARPPVSSVDGGVRSSTPSRPTAQPERDDGRDGGQRGDREDRPPQPDHRRRGGGERQEGDRDDGSEGEDAETAYTPTAADHEDPGTVSARIETIRGATITDQESLMQSHFSLETTISHG